MQLTRFLLISTLFLFSIEITQKLYDIDIK